MAKEVVLSNFSWIISTKMLLANDIKLAYKLIEAHL